MQKCTQHVIHLSIQVSFFIKPNNFCLHFLVSVRELHLRKLLILLLVLGTVTDSCVHKWHSCYTECQEPDQELIVSSQERFCWNIDLPKKLLHSSNFWPKLSVANNKLDRKPLSQIQIHQPLNQTASTAADCYCGYGLNAVKLSRWLSTYQQCALAVQRPLMT